MQKEVYVKEVNIIEKNEIDKEKDLIKLILKTTEDLKIANKNFEYAKDDLIDYYIYQIKANQSKLDYLIKIAKAKGIELDMISQIKFSGWEEEVS